MNIQISLLLVVLFILKHLICDFLLQTGYQAANKGKIFHPAGITHALINGVGTAVVIMMAAPTAGLTLAIWLGVTDMVSHYAIDYIKSNANRAFNLDPNKAVYWRLLAIDQALHWIMYTVFMVYASHVTFIYGPFVFFTFALSILTLAIGKKTIRE